MDEPTQSRPAIGRVLVAVVGAFALVFLILALGRFLGWIPGGVP